jgi:hypothetical protein
MFRIGPFAVFCGSESVAVTVTSVPPTASAGDTVSGRAPAKQASLATGKSVFWVGGVLFRPVRQPLAHTSARTQLLTGSWTPPPWHW